MRYLHFVFEIVVDYIFVAFKDTCSKVDLGELQLLNTIVLQLTGGFSQWNLTFQTKRLTLFYYFCNLFLGKGESNFFWFDNLSQNSIFWQGWRTDFPLFMKNPRFCIRKIYISPLLQTLSFKTVLSEGSCLIMELWLYPVSLRQILQLLFFWCRAEAKA